MISVQVNDFDADTETCLRHYFCELVLRYDYNVTEIYRLLEENNQEMYKKLNVISRVLDVEIDEFLPFLRYFLLGFEDD